MLAESLRNWVSERFTNQQSCRHAGGDYRSSQCARQFLRHEDALGFKLAKADLETHLALISTNFIFQEEDAHFVKQCPVMAWDRKKRPLDGKRRLLDGKRRPLFSKDEQ